MASVLLGTAHSIWCKPSLGRSGQCKSCAFIGVQMHGGWGYMLRRKLATVLQVWDLDIAVCLFVLLVAGLVMRLVWPLQDVLFACGFLAVCSYRLR